MMRPWALACFALILVFPSLACLAETPPSPGTTTFILDGNRMYAELSFVRPDASVHKALAFIDMGSPSMTLTGSLFEELQLDQRRPLTFRAGNLAVQIPAAEVVSERQEPYSVGSDLKVEAMLPAGVLQKYQIAIDYRACTLTFAEPGRMTPKGIPTPFLINKKTGLIAVEASISGKPYAITIDNGSAYTWFRQSTVTDWLASHPEWERGVGAVGTSNMMMAADGGEASGILVRVPEITIGRLILRNVGALGPGPGRGLLKNLFDWYSTKNAVAVLGWIGGNVLKDYLLTIDYSNRTLYWQKEAEPKGHDLDQVGLTLTAQHGVYIVAAIATKDGKPTVEGVQPGDRLIRIDGLETGNATWGAIYSAMGGKPGETRTLLLDRAGTKVTVKTKVTQF